MTRPLLMIPGPIEVSPAVHEAFAVHPPSHVAPHVIEAFGASIEKMREVWLADESSQPFIVAGSGTLAMEMAVTNLVDPEDPVVVVNTGYFSDRMADMLRRRRARITHVRAPLGETPTAEEIAEKVDEVFPKVVFATHVDTSTGVRVDPQIVCDAAARVDALTVFDGVCATVGEHFDMNALGADVYLTGSQKAIGLPPGLALLVASARALSARESLEHDPPKSLDFSEWLPIMHAYEARKPSYFATPATNLILALDAGLDEILDQGAPAVAERHQKVADAFRAAWSAMGLELVPQPSTSAANTLSAVRYPEGVDSSFLAHVKENGAIIAGGLHPDMKSEYFRVGHMGYATRRDDWLLKTIEAVATGLEEAGWEFDRKAALKAFEEALS